VVTRGEKQFPFMTINLLKQINKTGKSPISPNVLKSPNLTYEISRFLAKKIPVPMSPKVPNISEFAEIAEFF
jgi:hypothetical protein